MTKKFGLKSSSHTNSIAPAELDQLAKVKWNSLQSDLANALGSWNELNDVKDKSPEEKQLEKVKTLIEDLKSKLNEF